MICSFLKVLTTVITAEYINRGKLTTSNILNCKADLISPCSKEETAR